LSFLIPAALVAFLERFRRLRLCPLPFFRPFFFTDVFYLLTGYVAGGSIAATYISLGSQFLGSVLSVPRLTAASLPLWVFVMLALLALDAGNYAVHYCLHRFNSLWEFHKIHHSSRELDWLATFRSHIIEQILRRLLAPIAVILIGFPLEAVIIAGAIYLGWAIFNHANIKLNLKYLETVFITPRLHRIHHRSDGPANNIGTVFTIWDKLGGTLELTEIGEEYPLGNGESDYPQSWLLQLYEPIRRVLVRGQIT
jgi:sterol desaturase/sphingolipid hydroxylase (fatty acid hydroxylase superfamily)